MMHAKFSVLKTALITEYKMLCFYTDLDITISKLQGWKESAGEVLYSKV